MKKLAVLRHKDILNEAVGEYFRKGNFVRIYPASGSDAYDSYFT